MNSHISGMSKKLMIMYQQLLCDLARLREGVGGEGGGGGGGAEGAARQKDDQGDHTALSIIRNLIDYSQRKARPPSTIIQPTFYAYDMRAFFCVSRKRKSLACSNDICFIAPLNF